MSSARIMTSTPEPETTVETLFSEADSPGAFARGYFAYLSAILQRIDTRAFDRVVGELLDARKRGRHIYILGNGGSAATSAHFASDLAVGVRTAHPFRAQSLSENVPLLTATGNDEGYAEIFVRQLRGRLQPGDVVLAISASGNSPNVLKAVRYANEHGAITLGFTAFDGGQLRPLVKVAVHVPTEPGQYGPAEDIHMVFEHIITNYLRLALADESVP